MPADSAVRLAVVYPDLLGTYGDGGNGLVLAQRLRWRGLAVEPVSVPMGDPVPTGADLYVLGGGEDGAQLAALERLRPGDPLGAALERGAVVLGVCAGLQVLGTQLPGRDGQPVAGLGLLDLHTERGEVRAVGEVVADPGAPLTERLTGYENHGGRTVLGPGAAPLATVRRGTGNGTPDRAEGAVQGRVTATYLHGPVLARNPELADALLAQVVGPLAPLEQPEVEALRRQRLAAQPPRER